MIPDAYVYDGYNRPTYKGDVFNYTRGAAGKEAAAITDSGSYCSYLHPEVVANVSRLFHPPAIRLDDGSYWAPCNATVPEFGVNLGGHTFWVSKENMYDHYHSIPFMSMAAGPLPSLVDTHG